MVSDHSRCAVAPAELWTRLRCSRCCYAVEYPGPVTVGRRTFSDLLLAGGCRRWLVVAPLRPPIPAVAEAMEVLAAVDLGAPAIEVDADLMPRATPRAAGAHVRERWKG